MMKQTFKEENKIKNKKLGELKKKKKPLLRIEKKMRRGSEG